MTESTASGDSFRSRGSEPDYYSRARLVWPRLDPRTSRARRDASRISGLIARRTNLPRSQILAILGASQEGLSTPAPEADARS